MENKIFNINNSFEKDTDSIILNPFMQFCKEHIEKNNNEEISLKKLGKIWDSFEEEKKNTYINTYNELIKEKKLNEKNNFVNNKNKKKISVPLFNSKKIFSHGKYKNIPNSLNKKKPFYKC